MKTPHRQVLALAATALLALGLAACGGSGDSSSSTTDSGATSAFVPKPHSDSGGGSEPFIVAGGDNSIQEYGGEASDSEFEQAATTLHNFLDARAEGNWAAACTYMSPVLIKSLEELATHTKGLKGCAEILDRLTPPKGRGALRLEAAQADVASLRVHGKQAFLIYTGPKGAVIAMGMTPEGGIWKVSNLDGTALN